MKLVINVTDKGRAFSVTTRSGSKSLNNTTRGGKHYPACGILYLYYEADSSKHA